MRSELTGTCASPCESACKLAESRGLGLARRALYQAVMGAALAIDSSSEGTTAAWPISVRARGWLPAELVDVVAALESGGSIEQFERRLAGYLGVTDVLCVWMNWPRRIAWSESGTVSRRLQELVPEVAGSGRRVVLPNAIVEPIGAAPCAGALVVKGARDHVLQTHVVRLISRIAARIAALP